MTHTLIYISVKKGGTGLTLTETYCIKEIYSWIFFFAPLSSNCILYHRHNSNILKWREESNLHLNLANLSAQLLNNDHACLYNK